VSQEELPLDRHAVRTGRFEGAIFLDPGGGRRPGRGLFRSVLPEESGGRDRAQRGADEAAAGPSGARLRERSGPSGQGHDSVDALEEDGRPEAGSVKDFGFAPLQNERLDLLENEVAPGEKSFDLGSRQAGFDRVPDGLSVQASELLDEDAGQFQERVGRSVRGTPQAGGPVDERLPNGPSVRNEREWSIRIMFSSAPIRMLPRLRSSLAIRESKARSR